MSFTSHVYRNGLK
ncbi:hypothetical protein B4U80_09392 [Leptotrombidium deliense]|uniref:Uncharacterized protein n=1 Tax=Leptotrombidium deliense TaxID=299467 RepID=A0A443RZ21_9ACAR|nr:hypothetical protein B4U80_09392 [Leptotrombidium deliense]